MGSCAFLMPISSVQFVKTRTYHVQAALGLAIGGLPAVLIAGADRRVAAARRGPLAGGRRRRLHVAEHAADRRRQVGKRRTRSAAAESGRREGRAECVNRSSSSPAPAAKSATASSRASPAAGSPIITLDVSPLDASLAPLVAREFTGSITDISLLDRILAEFEVERVFHLAALLSTRSEFTPVTAHHVNVEGTLNLLEFAQRAGRIARPAGRRSSTRRRSPPTGCRASRRRLRAGARHARTSSRIRRRCTGATSCTASSSGTTTRSTTSSCRPTRSPRVDFRCVRFPGSDLGDDAARPAARRTTRRR